jgi:hypothetical protein
VKLLASVRAGRVYLNTVVDDRAARPVVLGGNP